MSHKSGSKYKPGAAKPRSLKARAEKDKAVKTWTAKSKFNKAQEELATSRKAKSEKAKSDKAKSEKVKSAAPKVKTASGMAQNGEAVETRPAALKVQSATLPSTPGRQKTLAASDTNLKVHVKTSNKRKLSSTLWLQRQLNDPYVQKAKREGYRSRAAYKFIEIDERYHLLKPGQRIVDLGCAPGGWAQVAAQKSGSAEGRAGAKVVGIDLLEVEPIPGVNFEVLDFTVAEAPARLKALLGGEADGVLSDMAANTIGHKKTDHLRIIALAEMAVEFAREVLAPGGYFLAKVFQGGTENDLLVDLRRDFAAVRHVKPKASRQDSAELYVLATGFKGR